MAAIRVITAQGPTSQNFKVAPTIGQTNLKVYLN
jgi:hypothetical protein